MRFCINLLYFLLNLPKQWPQNLSKQQSFEKVSFTFQGAATADEYFIILESIDIEIAEFYFEIFCLAAIVDLFKYANYSKTVVFSIYVPINLAVLNRGKWCIILSKSKNPICSSWTPNRWRMVAQCVNIRLGCWIVSIMRISKTMISRRELHAVQ